MHVKTLRVSFVYGYLFDEESSLFRILLSNLLGLNGVCELLTECQMSLYHKKSKHFETKTSHLCVEKSNYYKDFYNRNVIENQAELTSSLRQHFADLLRDHGSLCDELAGIELSLDSIQIKRN